MADWQMGEFSGVDIQAYPDGLYVSGWYDSFVGIEGGFIPWADIEVMRAKAKRRVPFTRVAGEAKEKP